MAKEIAKGAEMAGVMTDIKTVDECISADLVNADGIVVGSPTYFSNVAWQIKKLIDESIVHYDKGRLLRNKIGGCFTSSGTRSDGEDCIRMLELAFGKHHGLRMLRGIVSTAGNGEEEVSKMCRQYGIGIARQILSG